MPTLCIYAFHVELRKYNNYFLHNFRLVVGGEVIGR